MSKYPENWSSGDIHYHETGEVLCAYCYKYCVEVNSEKDKQNNDVCPDCAEDHTCYICGEIHETLLPFDDEKICALCKETLIKVTNL